MVGDPALGYQFHSLTSVADLSAAPDETGVVLLDADMPGSECMALLERMEGDMPDCAVVVVVAPAMADRTLPGFEGARHLVAPFHKQDLLTTIAAEGLSGRNGQKTLRIGRLSLNLALNKAYVDEELVPLTGKEYEVLHLLAARRNVTLSKEMFLDKLYGGLDEPEVKIIDVFICKIRGKLKKLTGGDGLIDTVWGRGYVLRDPEARQIQHRAAG
jgi:two-component system cell cycle response regulator CtrA